MRKLLNFTLLGLFTLVVSCTPSSVQKLGVFDLLPFPQELSIEGSSHLKYDEVKSYFAHDNVELPVLGDLVGNINEEDNASKAQIEFKIDASLDVKNEGYTLKIENSKITIVGKDTEGVFYGFRTLEQLLQDAKDQDVNLPLCAITDYPMLSYRAIHLDVKHHIQKTSYYYDLIDKMAGYKVNAIIAELEDKIQYELQPGIGSKDALSIDEWKKLSDYAMERNIEISPLIQGLGHSSFVLKHEKYKHLRDDPERDWEYNPLDPETYEVQFDLYRDAMKATPHGKYLHIGGDEVHTTGRGSAKSPLELQLIWLDKVCKFAKENNRIPIFWDDMPLKQAGVYKAMFDTKLTAEEVDKVWEENEHKLLKFLDRFPKNCIYMRWNYDSSEAIGNAKAMNWFRSHGMQVMGATAGQTRWVLMPQEESNMDNIRAFANSSIKNNLNGLLLTLWDDDSPHFELYMRGIIAFSEYTWTGDKRTKNAIKAAYRHRQFANTIASSENSFIDNLEGPVRFWKNALLKGNQRNHLQSKKDPLNTLVIEFPDKNKKGEWSAIYEKRLMEATSVMKKTSLVSKKITAMKLSTKRNVYSLEVYEQVNELVRFGTNILLSLKAYDNSKPGVEEKKTLNALKELKKEYTDMRKQFELVYGKTRNLTKPSDYILDQDHHVHLANQTTSFDWQFYAEMLMLEKIDNGIVEYYSKSNLKQ